jgi:hypothetical protein
MRAPSCPAHTLTVRDHDDNKVRVSDESGIQMNATVHVKGKRIRHIWMDHL